jgi:N-acyl-D-aspartate/D-glutamate deacylase
MEKILKGYSVKVDDDGFVEEIVKDNSGNILLPGFCEIHSHGAMGFDISVATQEALDAVSKYYLENGITAFAVGMGFEHTMLIELGILFDVMVLILVIGITVFGISREFQHIDADRLNKLDDITAPEAEYQVAEEK